MNAMRGGPLEPLERYRSATAISAPSDLTEQIQARFLFEPTATAPRQLMAALRALDLCATGRGLCRNASTAFRPGTRSMVLRAQAMAIVLVASASVAFGGVAGLAATRYAIVELAPALAKGIAPASDNGSRIDPPGLVVVTAPNSAASVAGASPEGPTAADPAGLACGLPRSDQADPPVTTDPGRCPPLPHDKDEAADGSQPEPSKPVGKGQSEPAPGRRPGVATPAPLKPAHKPAAVPAKTVGEDQPQSAGPAKAGAAPDAKAATNGDKKASLRQQRRKGQRDQD